MKTKVMGIGENKREDRTMDIRINKKHLEEFNHLTSYDRSQWKTRY